MSWFRKVRERQKRRRQKTHARPSRKFLEWKIAESYSLLDSDDYISPVAEHTVNSALGKGETSHE